LEEPRECSTGESKLREAVQIAMSEAHLAVTSEERAVAEARLKAAQRALVEFRS